jgi:hypothetical protein
MQELNGWLRENASTTTPPMTVVDTASRMDRELEQEGYLRLIRYV